MPSLGCAPPPTPRSTGACRRGQDGGGWRVVHATDLTASYGGADHAFMTNTDSSAKGTIDPKWRNGWSGEPLNPPISLKQNLNWLARRLGPDAGVLQVP